MYCISDGGSDGDGESDLTWWNMLAVLYSFYATARIEINRPYGRNELSQGHDERGEWKLLCAFCLDLFVSPICDSDLLGVLSIF